MALSFIGEETGVPWENRWPAANHWQTLSHNVASSTLRLERNSISPSWIVRVLGKNGRMWCQNLITWLKVCTMPGSSIFVKGYLSYHWSIVFWNCSKNVVFLVFIFFVNIFRGETSIFSRKISFQHQTPFVLYIQIKLG